MPRPTPPEAQAPSVEAVLPTNSHRLLGRALRPADQRSLRLTGLVTTQQVLGVEQHADRVLLEVVTVEERRCLGLGVERIDLQFHRVAVRVAVIHRYRRAMIDR